MRYHYETGFHDISKMGEARWQYLAIILMGSKVRVATEVLYLKGSAWWPTDHCVPRTDKWRDN